MRPAARSKLRLNFKAAFRNLMPPYLLRTATVTASPTLWLRAVEPQPAVPVTVTM
jgi:hypothetical protein